MFIKDLNDKLLELKKEIKNEDEMPESLKKTIESMNDKKIKGITKEKK